MYSGCENLSSLNFLPNFQVCSSLNPLSFEQKSLALKDALKEMYRKSDHEVLRRCGVEEEKTYLHFEREIARLEAIGPAALSTAPPMLRDKSSNRHYAASTSVTLLLWDDLVAVGHLGDSRVCLIYATDENLRITCPNALAEAAERGLTGGGGDEEHSDADMASTSAGGDASGKGSSIQKKIHQTNNNRV